MSDFTSCQVELLENKAYRKGKTELTEKILNLIDEKCFEIDIKEIPYKKLVVSVIELWNLLEDKTNEI